MVSMGVKKIDYFTYIYIFVVGFGGFALGYYLGFKDCEKRNAGVESEF
jgi:hypothetical protein